MDKSAFFTLFMTTAMVLFQCAGPNPGPLQIPPDFDWQGHRGCRGLFPENTVPAFVEALSFPEVRTLELDLAVSADSQLIVSHEPWFSPEICLMPDGRRITAPEAEKLLIYRMSVEEIRQYDCGSVPHPRFPTQRRLSAHKPTLREVVEAVRAEYPERAEALRWNIEIKSKPEWDGIRCPPPPEFAGLVIETLRELGILERSVVQSFDPRPLRHARALAPDLTLALLVENGLGLEKNLDLLGFTPQIYSPHYPLATPALLKKCREKGMKIIPWTVNEPEDMRRLIRIGVDGIITDYPDRIAQACTPG
ncbi:MAG: glycerophosphodiester phosphodiesterase family protein [Saprospiraceae bacterium]